MLTCAACGEQLPERARFCLACGTPLEEAPLARELRKTVTVVFSDVTGSTAIGERLDPEPLRRLLLRYYEAMKEVCERHGGRVRELIGDAVMAAFGIPTVHEDDALRAVRAAAEMRERLEALGDELEREFGVRLQSRTSVNTGEVVVRDVDPGGALALGDPVNVTARLEQAAQPGEILLGEATYRLVRDAVHAEPLEPLPVKGRAIACPLFACSTSSPTWPASLDTSRRRSSAGRTSCCFFARRSSARCGSGARASPRRPCRRRRGVPRLPPRAGLPLSL